MELKSRLRKVEQGYLLKKELFDEPDFSSWSDVALINYIKDSVERTHKEQGIKDYSGGVAYYTRLFDIGEIPTKEKLVLHLQMEKEYWNGEFIS